VVKCCDDTTNETTRTFTWTEDTTGPTFDNCTDGNDDLGCNPPAASFACDPGVTASDNCGSATVTCDASAIVSSGTGDCHKSRTLTYTAEDACGNKTTCVRNLTWIEDLTDPMISCPADSTVTCGGWYIGPPTFPDCATGVTASDNCGSAEILCSFPDIDLVSAGVHVRTCTCTATDGCLNTSQCEHTITGFERHCSLTQGAWGSSGGAGSVASITALLSSGNLIVGAAPGNTLTILTTDATCVLDRLPGGGTAASLPCTYTDCSATNTGAPPPGGCRITQNGPNPRKWNNVLLGQTVTLALNMRSDTTLGAFGLSPGTFCTQNGTFTIPASVMTALTSLGLGQTVGTEGSPGTGLLELANRGLGGLSTGGASLTLINDAVNAINVAFDKCSCIVWCGSCCTGGGNCGVMSQANCAAWQPAAGVWTQGGTCTPNPCPNPLLGPAGGLGDKAVAAEELPALK